ncbi:MAG: hypothetical protein ACXWQO_00340 [Bdellovibrionota bacterium]
MRYTFFITTFLFVAVGLGGISTSFAAKRRRFPVEVSLRVKDQDTKQPVTLPAKKGYSYEVKEQLTDVAVLRVFNSEGQALDGYYEITIEELHQLLNKKINAGLKATSGAATPPKCATCQVGDPTEPVSDRRPAVERPIPEGLIKARSK